MEFLTGKMERRDLPYQEVMGEEHLNQNVTIHGAVHALRPFGGVTFLKLRMDWGLIQCVCGKEIDLSKVVEEATLRVTGLLHADERAPGGREVVVSQITVLTHPAEGMPVPINKYKMKLNLDTELSLRPLVLRNLRTRSVFRIQEGICRAFHEHLQGQGFTEIHTPKIVHAGAEGGSNIFKLDYFGKKAYLAQSPQFYKQTMVGAFERVFEVAPVFRAEKHATPRHLNEYTSLDFEMGFIDGFTDVMEMETGFLQHMVRLLAAEYAEDLARLGAIMAGCPGEGEAVVLSEEYRLAMQTPQYERELAEGSYPNELCRGLGTQITDHLLPDRRMVGHQGNAYGSICGLFYDPETRTGFALLTNGALGQRNAAGVFRLNEDTAQAVYAAFFGLEREEPDCDPPALEAAC